MGRTMNARRHTALYKILGLATALTTAACTTDQAPPADPQRVVDQRVAIMKGFGGAIGATQNYAQGKATASGTTTVPRLNRAHL